MNAFLEGLVSIALAIVGLGVVATLVSKNANTAGVITASGSSLGRAITAAQGPVLGGNGGGFSVPSSFGGGFGS